MKVYTTGYIISYWFDFSNMNSYPRMSLLRTKLRILLRILFCLILIPSVAITYLLAVSLDSTQIALSIVGPNLIQTGAQFEAN